MDKKWQEWRETILLPLLKCMPGAISPEVETLLKRPPDEIDLALLSADVDRIQEYVFESAKLPEIRGGSALLTRLNETDLPQIVADAGLPAGFVDDKPPGCIIYASGGGLLALVPASLAPNLTARIEQLFPAETGQATITCVWRQVTPAEVCYGWGDRAVTSEQLAERWPNFSSTHRERLARAYSSQEAGPVSAELFQQKRGFGQLVQVMGTLLRQKKDGPATVPFLEALPFAARCRICQVRPAEEMYFYFEDEPWPLCSVCYRKTRTQAGDENNLEKTSGWAREARSSQIKDFLDWLDQNRPDLARRYWGNWPRPSVHHPQDLNDLGQACCRDGYIGFVYADGNQMGEVLERLPSPQAYRRFSQALRNTLKTAAYQALAENLRPVEIDLTSPAGRDLGQGPIHPLEPLVIGGDDLMLFVPGDAALPVTVRLCQLFEELIRQELEHIQLPEDCRQLTLSAGVVIASSHNPVRFLQKLARELAGSAKRRAYDEKEAGQPTSTLDYLVLVSQSMLRRSVNQLRKTPPYFYREGPDRRDKAGRLLTAAPFTLAEVRRLLGLLKLMRQVDFPASQLHGLVAALHQGRRYGSVHFLYQEARLKARLGPDRQDQNLLARLSEIWSYQAERDPIPWHHAPGQPDGVYASILPDLLELYSFVPKEERGDSLGSDILEVNHAHIS